MELSAQRKSRILCNWPFYRKNEFNQVIFEGQNKMRKQYLENNSIFLGQIWMKLCQKATTPRREGVTVAYDSVFWVVNKRLGVMPKYQHGHSGCKHCLRELSPLCSCLSGQKRVCAWVGLSFLLLSRSEVLFPLPLACRASMAGIAANHFILMYMMHIDYVWKWWYCFSINKAQLTAFEWTQAEQSTLTMCWWIFRSQCCLHFWLYCLSNSLCGHWQQNRYMRPEK